MKNLLCRTALFSLALGLASPTAFAQVGPGPFSAFPTEDPADGRFMGFGCAGLATFEQDVELSLAAAAGTVGFDINIFDGDTGGLDGAGRRHWDLGVRQLVFSLYADPTRTGSTDPADLIGQWFGNSANATSGPLWTSTAALMPDNAWWGLTVATSANAQAPSGNYFYNLVVGTDGSCSAGEQLESSLKIAASNPMTFRTPRFGLVGGLRQTVNDVPIIYPGSTPTMPVTGSFLTAPTTFDGTFSFFFTLPGGESELRLYDGDFDYGTGAVAGNPSGVPLDPCADVDDPDTDAAYTGFPFVTTGANPEGMQGPGIPPDDNFRDIFRRGESGDPNRVGCVRYEVTDPEGNVYFNDNPSGSFEWEQFLIASSDSAEAGNADWVYPGATLPGGTWRVTIIGLDLANLNFWFADTCASRPAHPPMPGEDPGSIPRVSACPDQASYLLGDTVWADTNGNGVLDSGEAGIPGVTMELIRPSDGAVIATTVTGDMTGPNAAACLANNTGNDALGLYCFGMDAPGTSTVRVATSNFAPGGPLAGLSSTTGGESQTFPLTTTNVLTYDFGYAAAAPTGSLGDRVWLDFDADGVQDAGEAGLNGVTVELLGSGGSVVASQATSVDGNYTFSNLAAGGYSVRVVSATLPAGLAPSYDLDGIGTAHVAAAALGAGENRTDVDFGYRGTGSLGDRVWLDFDADGVQDAGEAGLNFVMVELLDGAKNVLAATSTSGDGRYTFQNLPLGTYRVRVAASTLPPGTVPTYDLDGLGSPHLAVAALVEKVPTRTDVDFGYRGTASLGDRVWFDGDGDAIEDAGEPGIGGVTVHLVNPVSKGILATAITGSGGEYVFANLSAGIYQVRVEVATLPAGLAPTFDLDGVGTPHVATAALAAGESRTDVDFGYRGVGQMGDRVWLDGDGDGVQDLLEPGIAGVTVLLLDGDGRRLARQTTGPDGQYLFVNLVAGNYRIQVDPASMPAGLEPTYDLDGISTPHVAVCPLVSKESRFDVDFGYRGAGALGDRVWLDGDGDGIQDPGELGLAGIDVILTGATGDVVAVATTGADGIYLFSALLAGSYTATVDPATLPAGYLQTFDFDGLATPHRATVPLGAGEVQLAVDFGYREPAVNPRCVEEAISDPAVQSTGTVHAIWMPGIGPDYQFTPSPGTFTEDVAAGTATIAGVVRSLTNRDNAWQVLLSFSGRTSTPPPGSPKKELRPAYYSENGGPIDAATWYYYPTLTGIFQGIGNNLGARVRVTRVGPAFQVGQGANGKNLNFGGSGWFAWTVEVQPTSGSSLPATGQGDVNVDILACPSDVAGPPGVGTTGYWRTHPSAWPTLAFKLGDRLYTRDDAVALLGTEARGDWTVEIAKRLIAARLNVTAGNEASCILETIDRANAWLQAYRIGSGIRSTSTAWKAGEPLAARLDAYNRGMLCAPPRE